MENNSLYINNILSYNANYIVMQKQNFLLSVSFNCTSMGNTTLNHKRLNIRV